VSARKGRLVVLEGIDGSGKSTLADALAQRWSSRGRPVARWHEPTDPALGTRAAELGTSDPWAAAMLFTLDRALARPTLEALLRRSDVVADRSFYSTLAYQGSVLPPPARRHLVALERAIAVAPDVVGLLDLDPATALSRVGRRGSKRSRFERIATLRRVARAYLGYARAGGWPVFDARRSPAELLELADAALSARRAGRRVRRA
jgi:dTMP kinase